MSLVIRYTDKNNIYLRDIVNYACINACANGNIYFKPANEVEFTEAAYESSMLLAESDQLIVIWDENKKEGINTITKFHEFKNQNARPICSEVSVEYGIVSVPMTQSCHMLKVQDNSFISVLYTNSKYKHIFKSPQKYMLQNPAYNSIIYASLKHILNTIVTKK